MHVHGVLGGLHPPMLARDFIAPTMQMFGSRTESRAPYAPASCCIALRRERKEAARVDRRSWQARGATKAAHPIINLSRGFSNSSINFHAPAESIQ